jgi:taurine dioxygenase
MATDAIRIAPLRDDLTFGARLYGVSHETLEDPGCRRTILDAFQQHGLLVFEDVEESPQMQLAISQAIGPLKDHPVSKVSRANEGLAAGIIDLNSDPDDDQLVVEIDGKEVSNFLPWHFDHSYNNELNRAGVLRPVIIAPDGGLTGFADGIALYESLSPSLKARLEGVKVIYDLGVMTTRMRFGLPEGLRIVRTSAALHAVEEQAKTKPRALHPAVWTRPTGEKVLHVGLLHAVGIEGRENQEGDALLREVADAIVGNTYAYYHQWRLGQMLTWDNWRMLHCVTGTDPRHHRQMHRTTIAGDYGLGAFENGGVAGDKVAEGMM